jgi:hypothetical protein
VCKEISQPQGAHLLESKASGSKYLSIPEKPVYVEQLVIRRRNKVHDMLGSHMPACQLAWPDLLVYRHIHRFHLPQSDTQHV